MGLLDGGWGPRVRGHDPPAMVSQPWSPETAWPEVGRRGGLGGVVSARRVVDGWSPNLRRRAEIDTRLITTPTVVAIQVSGPPVTWVEHQGWVVFDRYGVVEAP